MREFGQYANMPDHPSIGTLHDFRIHVPCHSIDGRFLGLRHEHRNWNNNKYYMKKNGRGLFFLWRRIEFNKLFLWGEE